MMSLWDALRMNMMISYQELVRTFPRAFKAIFCVFMATCLLFAKLDKNSLTSSLPMV
ncbi:Uncharacterised protein [Klebsiella pneumoniae]|nr:hypothetical protein Q770_19390 [Klebsiella pneumoniae subsp. pneumoniae PittNDM01]SSJ81337.1 Uncharacterised protein [Klebsiella pneumoniae]SSJ96380.1 Uncharacterised protein [Klebsiella pneumoniae]SSP73819.1 Uncharacterised protein [Klebsiella pneumoniae]